MGTADDPARCLMGTADDPARCLMGTADDPARCLMGTADVLAAKRPDRACPLQAGSHSILPGLFADISRIARRILVKLWGHPMIRRDAGMEAA